MTPATGADPQGVGDRLRRVGSFVLGIFTRNLAAKVAAMLLALLVWVTIRQDLTKTYTDPHTYVKVELDPGLMEVGHHPAYVKVEFEGPASQIDAIQRKERAEIRLAVRQGDLANQKQASLVFSLDRGNVQHTYGDEVKIVQMDPPTITLDVAERGDKTVPVNDPRVIPAAEWKVANLDVITKHVKLTGPAPALADIASVTPDPIDAKIAIEGVNGNEKSIRRVVDLPARFAAMKVTIAHGERIEYQAMFVRSQVSRTFQVPFIVLFDKPRWPAILVVDGGSSLEKNGDHGFTIPLTFVGSSTDLAALKKAIDGDTDHRKVFAYVLADDYEPYLKKDYTAHNYMQASIRLEWPSDFWGRVTLKPPGPQSILVEVQKR